MHTIGSRYRNSRARPGLRGRALRTAVVRGGLHAVLASVLVGVAVPPTLAQNLVWVRQFGTPAHDDTAEGALAVDAQGSVYVGGATYGALPGQTSLGSYDAYLKKYTAAGVEAWTRQFGSPHSDRVSAVATDLAGNVYAAGAAGPLPGQPWLGHNDAFLVKHGAEGQVIWTSAFGTPGVDAVQSVTSDANLNVYVAGHAVGALPGQSHRGGADAFVRMYDQDGGVVWTRQFGTESSDLARAVEVAGGYVYVVGYTGGTFPGQTAAGGSDAFISKYDRFGNEVWASQFGTAGHDEATAVVIDSAGFVYVLVFSAYGPTVLTYLPHGELLDVRQTDHFLVYDMDSDGEDNLYVFGDKSYQSYLTAETATGQPLWNYYLGATGGSTWGRAVAVDQASHILVAGLTFGQFPGDQSDPGDGDVFVAKVAVPEPNVPPLVEPISIVPAVVEIGTSVTATADFSDDNTLDLHTATWHWGDGTTSVGEVQQSGGTGTASGEHAYTAAGVYEVRLDVADIDGALGQGIFQYVVAYDTEAGFVTGAGIIESPPGAYVSEPTLEGAAVFGFFSRYQMGAQAPTGQAQFRFRAADLDFRSTAHDWLVVAGAHAKFKGRGALGGVDGYGFMVTATDGQRSGGGGNDRFRIKIWESGTGLVVYDNQPGEDDSSTAGTEIRGGSIAIHSPG